jgi:transposase-like protein
MEFPITDLLDYGYSVDWIRKHFHPKGLQCPNCKTPVKRSRAFRRVQKSGLMTYRCYHCDTAYNLYTNTEFAGCSWTPMQVILFLRGVCKGEPTRQIATELRLNYKTVLHMRHKIQANAEDEQPTTPLPDAHSETDEMFQNAGEKR